MLTIAVKIGQFVSQGTIGAGVVVVAQAAAVDSISQVVGGGVIIGVGVIALRMILAAARHERESAATIQTALLGRIGTLEQQLVESRAREAALQAKYDSERDLRISLERAGITERRHDDGTDVDGTPV